MGILTPLSSLRLNDMWTIGLQDRELTCWEEVRSWGAGLGLVGGRELRALGGWSGRPETWGLRWVGVEAALLPLPKPSLVLGLALSTDLPGLHDQF